MAVQYNKLWKMLIDKNMTKKELRIRSGITTNALAKLGKNEHVSTAIMEKICAVLDCGISDVMEFADVEKVKEKLPHYEK